MNAEIIAVGTELLLGQILNTNAAYLSRELAEMGIDCYYQTVVGDNQKRLEEVMRHSERRSDIHIFIGGLGPTKDDLTKETLSAYLNVPLVTDDGAAEKVIRFYRNLDREMTENNWKQAQVLKDSTVLKNTTGLAAGTYLEKEGHLYILLPGPPSELKPMFENEVKPLLLAESTEESVMVSRVLRFFGIGESTLASKLNDLIEQQTNPTIATYAGDHEVTVRLTAKGTTEKSCQALIDSLEKEIKFRVGEFLYGYGENNRLANEVKQLLIEKKLQITAAESLTGGAFQSELASVSGVSECFAGGIVTYSHTIKEDVLGVSSDTIERYGVVSADCAIEMAEKARDLFQATIGISFTGAAGPSSLEGELPGSVWIGFSMKGKPSFAKHYRFAKDRNNNRKRAVLSGLDLIRRVLLDLPLSNKVTSEKEK